MKFRSYHVILALGFIVSVGNAIAAEAPRPNIVLLMADDQGWGDVGYNGHERLQTPTLDAMARSGLRFDRFYAAAPVCSPTRASVMTGRHPNRSACFSWGHPLRPQEVTVAEALRNAGYATGHFGKWHLGSMRAGNPTSPGAQGFDTWLSSPNFFETSPKLSQNGQVIATSGEGSQIIVDAALEFIRSTNERRQPFLAVIWFGSPHSPYVALPEDREPYKDLSAELQNYYGEITAMDRSVGILRQKLRELGIANNTLLWYTSDNGAMGPGSTGGLSGKKGSLWEGGIRVPGIIEWPARVKSPAVCEIPCCSVDIYPTLLGLTGATVNQQPLPLDGINLTPVIDGKLSERSQPLGFWVYPKPGRGVNSDQILTTMMKEQAGGPRAEITLDADAATITEKYSADQLPGHAAWIDNAYKLHRIANPSGQATYQLFDLVKDRQEQRDLAAAEPERVARMQTALTRWQMSVIRSLNGEDYGMSM